MSVIKEKFINDPFIRFKWEITLSNGVKGKLIMVYNKETNYLITKTAKVYNIKTEKELKPFVIKKCGYLAVNIQLGSRGNYKTMTLHRLLGYSWIPNNYNKPVINHKDGNKLNLNLNNLEWSTYSENNRHALKNNLRNSAHIDPEKCNLTKHTIDEVRAVCGYLQEGYSPKAIHELFQIDYDFAQKIYKKETWKNISEKYDFSRVILYNKNFTIDDVKNIMRLYSIGCKNSEVAKIMNWEYNEKLRGRLRSLKKQINRFYDRTS